MILYNIVIMPVPPAERNTAAPPLEGYRAIEDPQNPFKVGGISNVVHTLVEEQPPAEADLNSVNSILAQAEYVPRGWAKVPLAKLIRRRIELGIDENIHDATYWLSEFECPKSVEGKKSYDPVVETTLVMAALYGEDPSKLPTSETKIDSLFASEVMMNGYRGIISGEITDALEFERQIMDGNLGYPTMADGELSRLLLNCQRHGLVVGRDKQTQALQMLNQLAAVRKEYNHEAQTWLQTHGTTPRDKLVRAWKARQSALRNGVADNPNAIVAWEKAHGLHATVVDMQRDGSLPSNVGTEELTSNSEFVEELSRLYDGRKVVKALGDFLRGYSPEALFPVAETELSDGFRAEILGKDDPRIFTVGGDTRCCMTPGGMANSCIEAGYSNPNVSILALYDTEGDLAAHSVLFTNPDHAPFTIVIDNIETNEGRDRNKIAELYFEFFEMYLKREELAAFDTVNLGMHNTEIFNQSFASTEPVPSVISQSDAHKQALLYQREPVFGPEYIPMDSHSVKRLSEMEREIYGPDSDGGSFSQRAIETRSNPRTHSYLIKGKDGGDVGYVLAYEVDASEAADGKNIEGGERPVLYIEDLGILPQHQRDGHGEKAFIGMLKLAERKNKSLLFHASDQTSWPIIESKKAGLEAQGFSVKVHNHNPDYFDDGRGAHLVEITRKSQET